MFKVLLVFLFFNVHHDLVGYQFGGTGSTVQVCQAHAAEIIGKLPKPDGVDAVFPLCIDTGILPGGDENQNTDNRVSL